MEKDLKLDRYSVLEMALFSLKNKFPDDIGLGEVEAAQEYIKVKFLMNTMSEEEEPLQISQERFKEVYALTQQDMDLCEKMLLRMDEESFHMSVLLAAGVMDGLRPVAGTQFYGFLGECALSQEERVLNAAKLYAYTLHRRMNEMGNSFSRGLAEMDEESRDALGIGFGFLLEYYSTAENYFEAALAGITEGEKTPVESGTVERDAPSIKSAAIPKKTPRCYMDVEPEELVALRRRGLFAIRDMAADCRLSEDLKASFAEELVMLAEGEDDSSTAVNYYEKAAILDSKSHWNSERIIKGLRKRLDKAGCLAEGKDPIGTLGKRIQELRTICHGAPKTQIPTGKRVKYLVLAALALIVGAVMQFTPLKDMIRGNTDLRYTLMLIFAVILGGYLLIEEHESQAMVFGAVVGAIIGFVISLVFVVLPILCAIVALSCLYGGLRSNASLRKDYQNYLQKKEFDSKARATLAYVRCAEEPFERMENTYGLQDIKDYYARARKDAEFYVKWAQSP